LSSNDKIVEKLRFVFNIYDLDNDGRIHQKEMVKVITCLYDVSDSSNLSLMKDENLPKNIAKEIIKKFDKDGNKCLTQNEFIDGCLEYAQVRSLIVPSSN